MKLFLPTFIAVILMLVLPGCKKNREGTPALENTTWKLKKEIWEFPNGAVQIFEKQSDLDGVSTWQFLENQKVKVFYQPYYFEQDGEWETSGNTTTIRILVNPNDPNSVSNYKIIELRETFMKLDTELSGSSQNGTTSKIYFELEKQ